MKHVITIGEPMVMFVADEQHPLHQVEHFTRYAAGAELNVSIGLRRLGHGVTYVTRLGCDPFGQYLHNLLKEIRIDDSCVTIDNENPTGFQIKSKAVDGDPEVAYYRRSSAASYLSTGDIDKIDFEKISHVHVTGIPLALSETSRESVFYLITRAKERSIPLTFDPNLRPSLWPNEQTMIATVNRAAAMCDIILPGLSEGRLLTGHCSAEEIARYFRELGAKTVIVKCGANGAYASCADETLEVPGFSVAKVVDTVGAGDGFAVGVIDGLLQELPLAQAIRQGNAIGARQVMVVGDNEGLPTREELNGYLERSERAKGGRL